MTDPLYTKYANNKEFYNKYKKMMDEVRDGEEDVDYGEVVTQEWIGDEMCNDPLADEVRCVASLSFARRLS